MSAWAESFRRSKAWCSFLVNPGTDRLQLLFEALAGVLLAYRRHGSKVVGTVVRHPKIPLYHAKPMSVVVAMI